MAKILEGWAALQEHQAAAQAEQLEALRVQAGLQTQALLQLAGGGDSASRQTPRIHLPKMSAEDDAQAFLEAFEVAAEACHWPRDEWVVRLLPLLSGEAQQAAHSLPPSARGVYQNLRKAVLDRTGYSPEEQRRRFRDLGMAEEDRPFAYAQRLTDLARRWLQPEIRSAAGVVEQVVLERFVTGLPAATATWVRCHRPSSLSAAVTLAEDHLVHCPTPPRGVKPEPAPRRKFLPRAAAAATAQGHSANPPNPSPRWFSQTPGSMTVRPKPQGVPQTSGPECWRCGQLGHWRRECPLMEVGQVVQVVGPPTSAHGSDGAYCIPVRLQGSEHLALLDSGAMQTLIQQSLVRPEALVGTPWVSIRCVHGDVHKYPIVPVEIYYQGKKHIIKAAVSSRLSHPLILGTDWAGFTQITKDLVGVRSRRLGKCEVCAAGSGNAGAADAAEREPMSRERSVGTPSTPEFYPMEDFPLEQSRDDTLRFAFDQVKSIDGQLVHPDTAPSHPYFAMIKDRLYRVGRDTQTGEIITQLLVPKSRREMIFQAAHYNPMAGHLGCEKTQNRIMDRFFWPGIWADVRRWCAACPECQLVNTPAIPKAPLRPLPLVEIPFDRVAMDLIGPFDRSTQGYRFVLVLMDYATRYPEAVPLRNISAKSVAQALFQIISRVGIPKEILTDQGTSFMSRTLRELYELLGIQSIRTSVYHPQTDGLVERFNRTLKSMIRKFVHDDSRNWDKWLVPLLFAVREVPQASTGFSPFELLFGRKPRGVLDLIKENWEEGPSPSKNEIQYVMDLRAKLHTLGQLSRENLLEAQERQQRLYNRGTKLRQFSPGDKVLVLLPTSSTKLLAKWQGPFVVTRRVGDVDYEVQRADREGAKQIYHLNLLKAWKEVVAVSLVSVDQEKDELGPEVPKLTNLISPLSDSHLSPSQRTDLAYLQKRFADVFSPLPGRTHLINHRIETTPGVSVRTRPYRLPEHKRKLVQAEIKTMLELGVIEESHSAWSSPIVLVGKPDGSIRFCVDYRKVNDVSRFDAYPMPRVDELLDRLGTARFFSTLDLTKGYWQIPLSPESKEKTAFSAPDGLYQFRTLPFGLFGAPATFQRLMDRVLRPHAAFAAAYLDDVIIHSDNWAQHLRHVAAVLESLRQAGLTANPKKCTIGRAEVRYLGYHLGRGQVRPLVDKTAAIATCLRPKTKKEVRRFLGLAGYYRRFIPAFAELTSPLTDLTRKGASDPVQWTEPCQRAFERVKEALCGEPLLFTPNFSLPFILQTDASDRGLGAVLTQQVEGVDRPVLYISRKLSQRETKYSTVEKECLAIRWAVGSLRYYLLGRPFTLCSDHAPLQWLHRMKDTNARITRWYLALQPFNFKVVHRPGALMVVADFLSRPGGGVGCRPEGSPA